MQDGAAGEVPHFQVSTEEVPGPAAFDAFQQSVQDVFALTRLSDGDYRLDLIAWHLGTLMLGTFRSSAMAFDRSPALVGSGGLDHVLVQHYVEGGFTGTAGDRAITVRTGDVIVFDLAQPLSTRASDFCNISLLVPRAFFEASGADVSALHGLVLPSGGTFTAMLASCLIALAERLPTLRAAEAELAAKSTAALATTMLAGQDDRSAGPGPAIQSPFRRISAEIDRRLREPGLDAETLAAALGMSRATLYRVFAPVGGIAEYIRRRRLTIAAVAMAAPENRRRKLSEIAFDSGFASESAFSRAFKAAFGLPPSQARERSLNLWSTVDAAAQARPGSDFARWMRTLRA